MTGGDFTNYTIRDFLKVPIIPFVFKNTMFYPFRDLNGGGGGWISKKSRVLDV